MKVKLLSAALAAGLITFMVTTCQAEGTDSDCEWELESVAHSKPVPRPKINQVKPQKPAVKMPTGAAKTKPVKMPTVKPQKPASKPPKGKVWEYDCH